MVRTLLWIRVIGSCSARALFVGSVAAARGPRDAAACVDEPVIDL
jgi:hypothetical protein